MQHEETEWETVQKRFGNLGGQAPLPPAEIPVNEDILTQYTVSVADRMVEKQRMTEDGDGDPDKSHDKDGEDAELDELDDMDPEEREFFEQYRKQRMAEMMMAQNRFGHVVEVTAQSFVSEVTDASKKGVWVVVMLGDENRASELLHSIFLVLAEKFPQVKFVHGVAAQCMPKVPEKKLPIILIYKDGKIKKQELGMATFGGARATPDGKY